jgi:hypothetical protein
VTQRWRSHRAASRVLLTTLVGVIWLAGCGEEASEDGPSCACEETTCQQDRCALRVINECPEQWGQANVFVNDTSADAEPAGVSTADQRYESCEGFAVGEDFSFIVQSEDKRTVSETVGATFSCDGNKPFEFKLNCLR